MAVEALRSQTNEARRGGRASHNRPHNPLRRKEQRPATRAKARAKGAQTKAKGREARKEGKPEPGAAGTTAPKERERARKIDVKAEAPNGEEKPVA